MEEKTLIQSNNTYAKTLKTRSMTATVVSALAFLFMMVYMNSNKYTFLAIAVLLAFVVSLALLIFSFVISKTSITVSNKRVYGCASFGKRVDLPLDSIAAVGVSAFKGIAIGTSSGKISFKGIGNRDEIHDVISKLLIERQQKPAQPAMVIQQEAPQSNADELKKYKELLDNGIITQAEFDAKKKQLLGL